MSLSRANAIENRTTKTMSVALLFAPRPPHSSSLLKNAWVSAGVAAADSEVSRWPRQETRYPFARSVRLCGDSVQETKGEAG